MSDSGAGCTKLASAHHNKRSSSSILPVETPTGTLIGLRQYITSGGQRGDADFARRGGGTPAACKACRSHGGVSGFWSPNRHPGHKLSIPAVASALHCTDHARTGAAGDSQKHS